jgi:transposase-like protein
MIVLCSPHPGARDGLEALLSGYRLLSVGSWSALDGASRQAECALLVIEELGACADTLGRLQKWPGSFPGWPVVLVTRFEPENARLLKDLVLDEVVWWHAVASELAPALERVLASDPLERLGHAIEAAQHLPPRLRHALALAAMAAPPPGSVKALARRTGVHRSTLWREWREAGLGEVGRLEEYLRWLVLLRATMARAASGSWTEAAGRAGTSEKRLRRIAGRFARHGLGEVAAAPQELLAQPWSRRLVSALAGTDATD